MEAYRVTLYHTSSGSIEHPDVHYGRWNADFGGGFYLSDSREFAQKWASERKAYVNEYTLDLTGLTVKRFSMDQEWFSYLSENRAGYPDAYGNTDVIIGPIAADTLYDTYGILTSGLIQSGDALKLLSVGQPYTQLNVKTERAAAQLRWEGTTCLSREEILAAKATVRAEESAFRDAFWQALRELDNYAAIEELLS